MKSILLFVLIFMMVVPVHAVEDIVFTGIPTTKISEGGSSRTVEILPTSKSIEFKCTITKLDNKYYWTTRENIEMLPIESGAFITFLAINGSGYVRIVKPEMKEMLSLMGDTEEKYDYVEHLLLGLKSVTYYGQSK